MEKNIAKKIDKEKRIVSQMIRLYCAKNHNTIGELCDDCAQIQNYCFERINRCPHMANKTFCSSCKTHCYKPECREKIRSIMRFSGPRMLFYHPLTALSHICDTVKNKKRSD